MASNPGGSKSAPKKGGAFSSAIAKSRAGGGKFVRL